MMLTIVLALIFGFLAGALGAVCMEVYFQRRATDAVGDYDLTTSERGRHAG